VELKADGTQLRGVESSCRFPALQLGRLELGLFEVATLVSELGGDRLEQWRTGCWLLRARNFSSGEVSRSRVTQ
jgi:hypothetical protein